MGMLMCMPLILHAQMRPRDLNVGISFGYGGVHSYFMPALDLSFRSIWWRASWTPSVFSAAWYQDFWKLINTETDVMALWLSAGYMRTNDNWVFQPKFIRFRISPNPVDGVKVLFGFRFDFQQRLSVRWGIGVASNYRRDTGNLADSRIGQWRTWPNLELGMGIRLFPTKMRPKQ